MQHAMEGVAERLRSEIGTAPRGSLPEVSQRLWAALAAGLISDSEAEHLDGLLRSRLQLATAGRPQTARGLRELPKPSRPRSPESMARRRRWAASGRLPPKLAASFTYGEHAVLAVVAVEIVKRGRCTLTLGHLAAMAGVSVSTVKRAFKQAQTLGLIQVKERRLSRFRNDTNVVTVISTAWLSWLKLARREGREGGVQNWTGTYTNHLNTLRERHAEPDKRLGEKVKRDRSVRTNHRGLKES